LKIICCVEVISKTYSAVDCTSTKTGAKCTNWNNVSNFAQLNGSFGINDEKLLIVCECDASLKTLGSLGKFITSYFGVSWQSDSLISGGLLRPRNNHVMERTSLWKRFYPIGDKLFPSRLGLFWASAGNFFPIILEKQIGQPVQQTGLH